MGASRAHPISAFLGTHLPFLYHLLFLHSQSPQPGFQDLTMQDVAEILVKKPRVGYETPIWTSSTYTNSPLTGKEGHRTKAFIIIFYVH